MKSMDNDFFIILLCVVKGQKNSNEISDWIASLAHVTYNWLYVPTAEIWMSRLES